MLNVGRDLLIRDEEPGHCIRRDAGRNEDMVIGGDLCLTVISALEEAGESIL